ncbi:type II toxin-antitoxin system VapC family toxin [Aureimonas leprariae]|uniref:Ribonuclease VapC n=1 Tax=Plantimonas leprariae TaxID=2615207 RepID=A0A7V7PMB9_9HYPH|nr:type II toxin-antitoxin system VapC family toxin [Aureimonas leprariae]KAB0678013.1 type II toxin-antitoxin system VapC family toxin [Aureimonas leprariae]
MTISILVDTNILIDLVAVKAEPAHREWSSRLLLDSAEAGRLVVNTVVWAEATQDYRDEARLRTVLSPLAIAEEDLPFAAAFPAGQAYRLYREREGKRDRTLPDFLIGAHALVAGHRLLTRDGRRYRTYFPALDVIDPESHP